MREIVKTRILEYVEKLSNLLKEMLGKSNSEKLIAISQNSSLNFKHMLEQCARYEKKLSLDEYAELQMHILIAFQDATENYWYNRLSDSGISDDQIEEWRDNGLDMSLNIDFEKHSTPMIISKFDGIAGTEILMNLTSELLINLEELSEILDSKIKGILESHKLESRKERVLEYVDELSALLLDRLAESDESKVLALSEKDNLLFKEVLEQCPNYEKEYSKDEYSELKACILIAFSDATENYWYNRLSDLGISEEKIEEWLGDGLEIDSGIDLARYNTPLIISRFKGIAYTKVYMDLTPELLTDLDELALRLDDEIKRIIEVQNLDIEL